MSRYVAFLRGVNVGGNAIIKMADLRLALTDAELADVKTYIQSGNVLFSSNETDTMWLSQHIQAVIKQQFSITTDVVIFSSYEWRLVISNAPAWWGQDAAWKHNLLIIITSASASSIMTAIGTLRPDIERVAAGKRVVYQSILLDKFGSSTSGKLASNLIYKSLTIRKYNTTIKLGALLEKDA